MKRRWVFSISLVLGALALTAVLHSVNQYSDAHRQLNQLYLAKGATAHSPAAEALLRTSRTWSFCSVVLATGSGFCLFLSHREKEPAWRWVVVVILCLYSYLLLGPL
jgi:hypothetical protein